MDYLSIAVSIFAVILSYLFYRSSQRDSKRIEEMTTNIEKKTEVQYELIKQMSDKTLNMIESHTNKMFEIAFANTGLVNNDNSINYEMEIYMLLLKENKTSISNLKVKFGIFDDIIIPVLNRMIDRELIKREGDYILLTKKDISSISSFAVSSEKQKR